MLICNAVRVGLLLDIHHLTGHICARPQKGSIYAAFLLNCKGPFMKKKKLINDNDKKEAINHSYITLFYNILQL